MGSFSIWHWLIVLVVILLLFGRGKIPGLMGDMAKGIKAFKSGLKEGEEKEGGATAQPAPADMKTINAEAQKPANPTVAEKDKAANN